MKRIGLLGGMSFESSLEYYRLINEFVKEQLGGSHSSDCIMYSFDFYEIERLQHNGQWDELKSLLVNEALNLKKAGAELIVICTNTMHLMAKDIFEATELPLIHIAEAAADEIIRKNIKKVLLLGTKFTMEGAFYREKLENNGIEVIIPDEADRQIIHDIIYNELVRGIIKEDSKKSYIDIINKSISNGAKGVVLGCTEIPLLIKREDLDIDVFDTTFIHSKAAVDFALEKGGACKYE